MRFSRLKKMYVFMAVLILQSFSVFCGNYNTTVNISVKASGCIKRRGGRGNAFIKINGENKITNDKKGIYIVVLDDNTGDVLNNFKISSENEINSFNREYGSYEDGKIIVMVTYKNCKFEPQHFPKEIEILLNNKEISKENTFYGMFCKGGVCYDKQLPNIARKNKWKLVGTTINLKLRPATTVTTDLVSKETKRDVETVTIVVIVSASLFLITLIVVVYLKRQSMLTKVKSIRSKLCLDKQPHDDDDTTNNDVMNYQSTTTENNYAADNDHIYTSINSHTSSIHDRGLDKHENLKKSKIISIQETENTPEDTLQKTEQCNRLYFSQPKFIDLQPSQHQNLNNIYADLELMNVNKGDNNSATTDPYMSLQQAIPSIPSNHDERLQEPSTEEVYYKIIEEDYNFNADLKNTNTNGSTSCDDETYTALNTSDIENNEYQVLRERNS